MSTLLVGPKGEPVRPATFSADKRHRYELRRLVDATGHGEIAWVMLNPSIADEVANDPTIRRCIDFSRRWGFAWLRVVNLCAIRSTDPKAVRGWNEPPVSHPYFTNLNYICAAACQSDVTMLAWGTHGEPIGGDNVREDICCESDEVWVLGWTANGQPRHPLYVKADTRPAHAERDDRRWLRS